MPRVTRKDLDAIAARINRMTGNPAEPYRQEAGRITANVGSFHISSAYGGWALHQMVTEGGGVRDVLHSGHVPARELQGAMFAYIAGLMDAERPAVTADATA